MVAAKLEGLSRDELAGSQVPSGWTPAGLVHHLVNVERRWLEWGFLAEQVDDPWRDRAEGGGWVGVSGSVAELKTLLDESGARTRRIVEAHRLTDVAGVGGRFTDAAEAPQLHWILLHLLQEYARHTGHLDIARELLDGRTGEEG